MKVRSLPPKNTFEHLVHITKEQKHSIFIPSMCRIPFSALCIFGMVAFAQAESLGSFTKRAGDLVKSLFYEAPPSAAPAETISQGAQVPATNAGVVLAIARTQDSSVPDVSLKKLLQLFAAKSNNINFKLVTIEDLVGTSQESIQGKPILGSMQSFASNQQAIQFANSQGIPGVITVSIDSMNIRSAKTADGMFLGNASGTVSLFSNSEGARLNSSDVSVSAKSFDEKQTMEKLMQQLASKLASQVSDWQAPRADIANKAKCEIHAKIEGLTMPAFVEKSGSMVFDNQSIALFAAGASVELDGVFMGQTPCVIIAGSGMRKLKVTRDGVKPFEAIVNLNGQSRHDVTLVPTEETLGKFNEQLAFLRKLNQQEKVNDANIKILEGYAKLLRQSGYRIDQRSVKDWSKLSQDKEDKQ